MTMITRCRLLMALLLSPLAMQQAAAGETHVQAASSTMPGHCDPSTPEKAHPTADCKMACASALPALDLPPLATPARTSIAIEATLKAPLAGLTPESATPPPRLS